MQFHLRITAAIFPRNTRQAERRAKPASTICSFDVQLVTLLAYKVPANNKRCATMHSYLHWSEHCIYGVLQIRYVNILWKHLVCASIHSLSVRPTISSRKPLNQESWNLRRIMYAVAWPRTSTSIWSIDLEKNSRWLEMFMYIQTIGLTGFPFWGSRLELQKFCRGVGVT